MLRISVDELKGLSGAEITRLREMLASRVTGAGELIVFSSEERSQRSNLERAYARMESLIVNAARLPRPRRPSKPGRAAREERLDSKHRLSLKKEGRRYRPEE
jgi:ribosome-associated protein